MFINHGSTLCESLSEEPKRDCATELGSGKCSECSRAKTSFLQILD